MDSFVLLVSLYHQRGTDPKTNEQVCKLLRLSLKGGSPVRACQIWFLETSSNKLVSMAMLETVNESSIGRQVGICVCCLCFAQGKVELHVN